MWIILICSTTKIRNRCPFEKKLKDVTVGPSVQHLTLTKSLHKYRPSGKAIAVLGAIFNRSLASPGINCGASINNVEPVSRLWTQLQNSLIKT